MKKLIAGVVILIIISIAAIYVFIPGTLTVSDFEQVQCSLSGANRILAKPENWKRFWQSNAGNQTNTSSENNANLIFNQDTFHIIKVLQNGLEITVAGSAIKTGSAFSLLPLSQDSIAINWTFKTETSSNPVKRIQQYNTAIHLKKNMELILKEIKAFLSKNEMVYGFPIIQSSTKDTLLISTKKEFAGFPPVEDIYKMIDKLEAYANANQAKPVNAPMMNITPTDSNHFMVMTALPINKMLVDKGDISYKRMIPGRFLTTTVTGGNAVVEKTQKAMQQYFQDYGRIAMAIPFMYLVTDRRKEKDSSKWVTKLYFPVM